MLHMAKVASAAKTLKRHPEGSFIGTLKRNKTLLLMLLPALILITIFAYLPMGGLVLAFKNFNYRDGIFGSPWVGLENFKFFFQSGQAWTITRNTALYNLAFILVNTTIEVGFAIVLSEIEHRRIKKLTQSSFFLPYFISWVVVGSIAYGLFNYEHGTVNNIITALGGNPVNVYAEPGVWPVIIIVFNAWKSVGYGMVVYLAAIVGVDASLHEAASIDGANIFQRTWHITLPTILPTVVTLTLMAIGKIFRGNLDLFFQLVGYNGTLFDATDVIDTVVFRLTTTSTTLGQPAAIGFYQSIMCFVTIMVVNWIVRRTAEDYALF